MNTQQTESKPKRYVPYGINGMYYIYDNQEHYFLPGQSGSSSRRMINRKCEQLNLEETNPKQPNKPQSESLYVEPLWFNGTKGTWYIDHRDGKIFIESMGNDGEENWSVEICQLHGTEKVDAEDAQLISQSKELAKALQDMLEVYAANNPLAIPRRYEVTENAKEVLKKAGL